MATGAASQRPETYRSVFLGPKPWIWTGIPKGLYKGPLRPLTVWSASETV